MRPATLLLLLFSLPALAAPLHGQDLPRDFSARAARIERAAPGRPLTPPSSAAPQDIVREYIRGRHAAATMQSLVVTRDAADASAHHLAFEQEVAGLRVHGAYLRASLSARGELLTVIDQLVPVPALVPERVGARDALASVLRRYYPQAAVPAAVRSSDNETVFAASPLFPDPPTATRIAVPMANGALHVGYVVETWDRDNILRHTVVGGDGRVLIEELRTNTDKYNVFANHPVVTGQQVVEGPGAGNGQSCYGWVTGNTTIGNNVDAYLDRDNNNAPDANGRPISVKSGQDAEFLAAADLGAAPTTTINQQVAVTNLFYLNNVIHDKLYRHGFTEAFGNFQTNNCAPGGKANDPVNAEAQDGGGTNNANFATPADGSRPRMQMYLWNLSTPHRDGDLDSDIVYHEYGHGLTWRMVGGMSGPLAGAIGEGMSDVLAIYLNDNDVVGEYSYNNPKGIRRYRYTDYPLRYGDVKGSSVHNDGEIYAAAMWKLRSEWSSKNVADEDRLFDYVVGGMKYTPSRPAYEHMRDGILSAIAADAARPAGASCAVWTAFAQFGIGEGAEGKESCRIFTCSVTIKQSFVVPATACSTGQQENTAPVVTISSPANGASFLTTDSITFAASVTDEDSNLAGSLSWISNLSGSIGSGATFPTSLAAGTHTITASVTDSGGLSGSSSIAITVTAPQSSGITLSVRAYKVKGVQTADLTWSGATGTNVDVYRTGQILTETANDGNEIDSIGAKGGGSYTYRVCEAGSTTTCSNEAVATF
jgi:extracellular elastinolytic metalloproteinase